MDPAVPKLEKGPFSSLPQGSGPPRPPSPLHPRFHCPPIVNFAGTIRTIVLKLRLDRCQPRALPYEWCQLRHQLSNVPSSDTSERRTFHLSTTCPNAVSPLTSSEQTPTSLRQQLNTSGQRVSSFRGYRPNEVNFARTARCQASASLTSSDRLSSHLRLPLITSPHVWVNHPGPDPLLPAKTSASRTSRPPTLTLLRRPLLRVTATPTPASRNARGTLCIWKAAERRYGACFSTKVPSCC